MSLWDFLRKTDFLNLNEEDKRFEAVSSLLRSHFKTFLLYTDFILYRLRKWTFFVFCFLEVTFQTGSV